MKSLLLLLLAVCAVQSYRFKLTPAVYYSGINRQEQTALIDINSADTYFIQQNLTKAPALDVSKVGNFKDLNKRVNIDLDESINYNSGRLSAYLGETRIDYTGTYSFGVIDRFDEDPSTTFRGDQLRSGRIGVSPFMTSNIPNSYGQSIAKWTKTIAMRATCYNATTTRRVCSTGWQADECFRYPTVSRDTITMPVIPHPKNYWQTLASSYSYGSTVVNRQLKIVFSTTTLDITVPQSLFNMVKSTLSPKLTKNGYEFDCNVRQFAQDIKVKYFTFNIDILSTIYTDQIDNKCYLRLKPSKENEWVMGLQFYYGYSACFQGNTKRVTLNKSLYGEF